MENYRMTLPDGSEIREERDEHSSMFDLGPGSGALITSNDPAVLSAVEAFAAPGESKDQAFTRLIKEAIDDHEKEIGYSWLDLDSWKKGES